MLRSLPPQNNTININVHVLPNPNPLPVFYSHLQVSLWLAVPAQLAGTP